MVSVAIMGHGVVGSGVAEILTTHKQKLFAGLGVVEGDAPVVCSEDEKNWTSLYLYKDGKIREICGLDGAVRLVITLGYASEDDKLRTKKRKAMDELVKVVE